MTKALEHLNIRDKQALAIFFALALLCSLYFASGVLVSYVSSPTVMMDPARDGRGFTVRVLGLQTFAAAEQLSAALRDQRSVAATIEAAPTNQGYLVKVGPLAKRESAEALTSELHNSGYSVVKIVPHCGPSVGDCPPSPAPTTSAVAEASPQP
jgi:hypothetical protein